MKKRGIIISISVILFIGIVLGGIFLNKFRTAYSDNSEKIEYPVFTEEDLAQIKMDEFPVETLKNIKEISKKYHLYENIYNSDKPVLVYGYEKRYRKPPISEAFHKNLMKELGKGDYSRYNIVALTNFMKFVESVEKDSDNCFTTEYKIPEQKELIELTEMCYLNSCLVDPQKNTYFYIPKAPNLIARVLQLYK